MPKRAAPLPPEERRAAILAATVPLLEAHGLQISTKQIAEAAGVAEGTLFRVFDNKDELIRAAVESVMDPARAIAALSKINPNLPLEARLVEIVTVMQQGMRRVIAIFHAVGGGMQQLDRDARASHQRHRERTAIINAAIANLIAPNQDQLRVTADEAARLLSTITFTTSHPRLADDVPYFPDQIVKLLLHGIASAAPADISDPQRTPCLSDY